MAKPSNKSEAVEKQFTDMTGVDRRKTIEQDICTFCKKPAVNFRDPKSEREYTISGLCQECQDEVFGT